MQTTSIWKKALLAGALLLPATTWIGIKATAFNPQPDPPGFSGDIGLAAEQTARLNAVNLSDQTVRVSLVFFDADGSVLKRGETALKPGRSASLDLNFREAQSAATDGGGRVEVRGAFQVLPAVQRTTPLCLPTLEVFGSDGKTTLFDPVFRHLPQAQGAE